MELTKLKKVMDGKGVKSIDLAKKTGLSFSTIQKARAGNSIMTGTATLIAIALKTKPGELE